MKKNIFFIGLILVSLNYAGNHLSKKPGLSLKNRSIYFMAPLTLAYSYNALTYLLYSPLLGDLGVQPLYWHNRIPLILGFQTLTYYCWSQAFSQTESTESPIIHVTIDRNF